ncbi:MAG TPA: hypothetical protein VEV41_01010 [Terriglobales bacterium]|nr:hypothetical protein [Terriglobales bacterium]
MIRERTTARSQVGECPGSFSDTLPAAEARVRELIAGRHSKAALEAAKDLHKRYATAGSEGVLLEAYEARIRDLLRHGMSIEAKSLLNLVIQRFPSALARLEEVLFEVRMSEGNLDECVAPLKDPNLAPAVRERIETAIRQHVFDLPALFQASSLPPTHSLRQGAAALIAALKAVTSAPVGEADLLLPQVSHRSPLASWKTLVNAIATFYRRDDATCRKWLQAIAADSVPARLLPALQAMLGSATAPVLNSAAKKLVAATGAGGEALRSALTSLESAMAAKRRPPILEKARAAVSVCERFCPDLREKLHQYITIRCMVLGFAPDSVRDAIGGSPRKDARWFHLMAKAMESTSQSFEGLAHALIAWEAFRELGLEEKSFAVNTVEDGVLSLHMAELAARIPADVADDLRSLVYRGNSPPSKSGLTPRRLFSPNALYERACASDPHSDAFQSWLAWAKKQCDWRVAERVAESWHQACPQDVAPLLWLMESSEKRSAYQKSLKYLEQAEQLDRLNPEVREAKLRLLLAGVLRHFRQHKPHLASQGIERIEASAERDGGLVALVSALRRVCAALDKDPGAVDRHAAEVEACLGSCVAAYVLHRGIADAAVLAPEETLLDPLDTKSYDGMTLLKGLAKACALADSVGIPLAIPEEWEDRLSAALIAPHPALHSAELLVVGEAAIRSQASSLAFAVSVAGMASGGVDSRFLFLRARALPPWASERRYDCLSAALELARRERNTDLTGKLLDELRCCPSNMFAPDDFLDEVGPDSHSMEPGFLNEILACERAAKQFPVPGGNLPARDECDEVDIFPDETNFAHSEDVLANMPPELARELTKAIARGAQPEEILKGMLPGRSGTGEREDLFGFPAAELLREIKKAMAMGVTPDDILEEMEDVLAGDFRKGRFHRGVQKKEKPGAVRPQQGSLF